MRKRNVIGVLSVALMAITFPGPAWAAQLCAADLNGNGDAADEGELASCLTMAGGESQCPISQVPCVAGAAGAYRCPMGDQHQCLVPAAGGTPTCSPVACIDTALNPLEDEILIDDAGPDNDGPVDADGNCLGTIEIFGGRALRCRPPGASVTFQNCCKDRDKIVKDGMGGSISSITTKIAIAKGVFTGAKAAYLAFKAGASAGQAASAGANAIIIGLDPTSIAISLAINFMMEVLLQGCDQQDMETGMLRGSGMCHEVGTYCSSSILGVCIQKARGHCCFNTKLGRIIQEQALTQHLALSLGDGRQVASADRLLPVLESAGLTPAQEQALVHMALSGDRITAVHGVAGAGKSMLVRSLKDAAHPGRMLTALAPTSSAAAELGDRAGIASRTVASLLASGGHGLSDKDVLILDEAGQLGNRQALRVLEISRATGARLILLGDNRQTGAIEQGKAFWLMQKLGMATAELVESRRQQTKAMKLAVTQARAGDYVGSLEHLDKVVSGADAEELAKSLVAEWTRLKPESRATTNILVLENATRLIVNSQIRETMQREGVVAAEDTRLAVLTPAGFSDQEKQMARFYSGGQVLKFNRDQVGAGLARDGEYRVISVVRDAKGRQLVRLADEQGRIHNWDPRTSKAAQVNVFLSEHRNLAAGDRIQWRLATKELDLKNAERGTVERHDGMVATVRWDRGDRVQQIDLGRHSTWDHGYAETVYSAQSKTYDRVYVLAPVASPLVNGQNFYTAITRARHGVKLWTEDSRKLVAKLEERSGEKTSALEGLGRLERDHSKRFAARNEARLKGLRLEQVEERRSAEGRALARKLMQREPDRGIAGRLAGSARSLFETLNRHLQTIAENRQAHAPNADDHATARNIEERSYGHVR